MTFDEAARAFLHHCRVSKSLSVHTLKAYAQDLAEARAYAGDDRPLAWWDRHSLRAYAAHLLDARGLKETSVKRRMACLRALFRWLELEEVIDVSPFHRLALTIRPPRRLPRDLSRAEIRALLAAPPCRPLADGGDSSDFSRLTTRLAVLLMLATGMRVGELTAVRLPDLRAEDGTIRIFGKGARERRVFVAEPEIKRLLRLYLKQRQRRAPATDHLLVTPQGQALTPQAVRLRLRRAGAAAGLERRITPHMLRHTAATQLLEAGVDIRFVQKLLGHHSIATTQIYTQVSDASLQKVMRRARHLRPLLPTAAGEGG